MRLTALHHYDVEKAQHMSELLLGQPAVHSKLHLSFIKKDVNMACNVYDAERRGEGLPSNNTFCALTLERTLKKGY